MTSREEKIGKLIDDIIAEASTTSVEERNVELVFNNINHDYVYAVLKERFNINEKEDIEDICNNALSLGEILHKPISVMFANATSREDVLAIVLAAHLMAFFTSDFIDIIMNTVEEKQNKQTDNIVIDDESMSMLMDQAKFKVVD